MNPAPSIIFFTTSAGLGYGMLIMLAFGTLLDAIPPDRLFGALAFSLAFATVTAGVISSAFHLTHPKRIRMAFSQWRSSWLSREAWAVVITYGLALKFGAGWVFLETTSGFFALMAVATALAAGVTVYCTGMIYASLPPIGAWNHVLTSPIYLSFALMTGALAVQCLVILFGLPNVWIGVTSLLFIIKAFGLKTFRWYQLHKERATTTMESATGLGKLGRVSALDPPQNESNYLLKEMGFKIGRKHARRIKALIYLLGFMGSLAFTALALASDGLMMLMSAILALIFGILGTLLERWLFFAEAEHTAILYYGGASKKAGRPRPRKRREEQQAPTRQRRPVSVTIEGKPSR